MITINIWLFGFLVGGSIIGLFAIFSLGVIAYQFKGGLYR